MDRDPEIPRSRDPEITRSRDPEMTRSIRWMVGSTGVRTTHTAEMPEQGRASMCVKETAIAVYVQPHEQAHQDPRPRDPEITRSGDDESGVWIHRPREHRDTRCVPRANGGLYSICMHRRRPTPGQAEHSIACTHTRGDVDRLRRHVDHQRNQWIPDPRSRDHQIPR